MADEQDNSFMAKLGRVFGNNPDAAIDSAVTKGYLSPAYAAELKSGRQLDEYNAAQAAAQANQPMTPQGEQDAQAAADYAENVAMQGTGVAPGFLPVAPGPMEPNSSTQGLPAYMQPNVAGEVQDEIDMKAFADARAQQAEMKAQADTQRQAAIEEQQRAQQFAEDDKKLEAQVDADNKERPNWGNAIAQAIAISLGAASQMYTGAKENPGLAAIEKEIEKQAAERKYSSEQKQKMIELAFKQADLKLRQEEALTDSAFKRAQIQKLRVEMMQGINDIEISKREASQLLKNEYTIDELPNLQGSSKGQQIASNLVEVRPGLFRPALDPSRAKKLSEEVLPQFNGAEQGLSRLRQLNQEIGNNYLRKVVDRTSAAEADSLRQQVVGGLRLMLFGPGVMSDKEQALAQKIIRNPTDFFTLASSNEASYNAMMSKLKFAKRDYLRKSGVRLDPSQNEQNIAAVKAKFPNAKMSVVIDELIKQGKWDPNEE